ncbi:7999_t:CDS:1 [Diversispora eburnea]|uniref:7999_t:CDS:1 n=1 Tax=Diversispora eburnea TaxID=1213867 RepID=A0A9N8VPA3_9GLOM|nr:7999_t:CDS:1 [Diversispora eburnea]
MTKDSFPLLILLVILFLQIPLSTRAYVNNRSNSSWTFWNYEDGHRKCANICITVFVITAVLLTALCVYGIFLCVKSKYKKNSEEEKGEPYNKETGGNSMDNIYV